MMAPDDQNDRMRNQLVGAGQNDPNQLPPPMAAGMGGAGVSPMPNPQDGNPGAPMQPTAMQPNPAMAAPMAQRFQPQPNQATMPPPGAPGGMTPNASAGVPAARPAYSGMGGPMVSRFSPRGPGQSAMPPPSGPVQQAKKPTSTV